MEKTQTTCRKQNEETSFELYTISELRESAETSLEMLWSVSDVYTLRSVRRKKLLSMSRDVCAVSRNFENKRLSPFLNNCLCKLSLQAQE